MSDILDSGPLGEDRTRIRLRGASLCVGSCRTCRTMCSSARLGPSRNRVLEMSVLGLANNMPKKWRQSKGLGDRRRLV